MDLRAYYKKLREVEGGLSGPFAVLVSLDTSDGGKAGVVTEMPRLTAAKLIMDNRARAASPEEVEAYHQHNRDAKQIAEQALAVSRMQFVVVPAKSTQKSQKD